MTLDSYTVMVNRATGEVVAIGPNDAKATENHGSDAGDMAQAAATALRSIMPEDPDASEVWEVQFDDDEETHGVDRELAEQLVDAGILTLSSAGNITNSYGDSVFSHTYLPVKGKEDAAHFSIQEGSVYDPEPCPVCGAYGPDESCREDGMLIDDHSER